MNARQKQFVTEYVKDKNATQAAIRSGYSKKTAYSIGQRLLKKVEIKNAINKLFEEIRKENIATAIEIEEYLSRVMRGDTEAEVVLTVGTGDGCSSVEKVRKKPDEKERLKAAELLGKRHGMFTDNFKVEEEQKVVIIDDLD